jgi:hypothetical protein
VVLTPWPLSVTNVFVSTTFVAYVREQSQFSGMRLKLDLIPPSKFRKELWTRFLQPIHYIPSNITCQESSESVGGGDNAGI